MLTLLHEEMPVNKFFRWNEFKCQVLSRLGDQIRIWFGATSAKVNEAIYIYIYIYIFNDLTIVRSDPVQGFPLTRRWNSYECLFSISVRAWGNMFNKKKWSVYFQKDENQANNWRKNKSWNENRKRKEKKSLTKNIKKIKTCKTHEKCKNFFVKLILFTHHFFVSF